MNDEIGVGQQVLSSIVLAYYDDGVASFRVLNYKCSGCAVCILEGTVYFVDGRAAIRNCNGCILGGGNDESAIVLRYDGGRLGFRRWGYTPCNLCRVG